MPLEGSCLSRFVGWLAEWLASPLLGGGGLVSVAGRVELRFVARGRVAGELFDAVVEHYLV